MCETEKVLCCKSFSKAAEIVLGVNYYNGNIKKELIKVCKDKYGIDIENIVCQNKKRFCLNCGNEINGDRKFCSRSCAASYNNKKRGKQTDKTKSKISKSLVEFHSQHLQGDARRNDSLKRYEYLHLCENCGREFYTVKKTQRFCSVKCAQENDSTKAILRNKMKEKVSNGTHCGWKTRNVTSYAEKFWENVLNENNVPFVMEDFSTKKYFLDFLIEHKGKRIDLEIDGKQHDYADRKEHDKIRDKFLEENGYVVYRVKWNEINSENGKKAMKQKINDFFSFLTNI